MHWSDVNPAHTVKACRLMTLELFMQALPIFIDRLLTPVAAILLSVTAVLIVGEIIPQVSAHWNTMILREI